MLILRDATGSPAIDPDWHELLRVRSPELMAHGLPGLSVLLRDLDLVLPDTAGYRFGGG